MKLYDYLPSQNAYKVRQLLAHLGTAYEHVPVSIFEGESHTDAFLAMNPTGAVPVLELDDGRTIAESNAILCYLAEGTPFLPVEPYERAKTLQWLFFEQNYVEPNIGALRHWTLTGKLDRNRGAEPARRATGPQALAAIERRLGAHEYLAAGRYTIADIAVFAYAHLAGDAGFDLARYPAFERWLARVNSQPGHLDEVHSYSIDPHSSRDLR